MSGRSIVILLLVVIVAVVLCAGCTTPPTAKPTYTPSATVAPPVNATGPIGNFSVVLSLTAQNNRFDKSTLAAPAGSAVALGFTNNDRNIQHNFALYTNASASTVIFKGGTIDGPAITTYMFTAPATSGTYFFRCDVHPETMSGSFLVT